MPGWCRWLSIEYHGVELEKSTWCTRDLIKASSKYDYFSFSQQNAEFSLTLFTSCFIIISVLNVTLCLGFSVGQSQPRTPCIRSWIKGRNDSGGSCSHNQAEREDRGRTFGVAECAFVPASMRTLVTDTYALGFNFRENKGRHVDNYLPLVALQVVMITIPGATSEW